MYNTIAISVGIIAFCVSMALIGYALAAKEFNDYKGNFDPSLLVMAIFVFTALSAVIGFFWIGVLPAGFFTGAGYLIYKKSHNG